MAMDVIQTDLLASNPWVPRRPITVAEYHRMGEVGILREDDRVELIEGQLVAMAPIGSDHSGTVNALNRLLVLAVGDAGVVAVGNPVRLSDTTEPQPDFSVLKPRPDFYRQSLPTPDDVLLVIEVANSSLSYDRAVKRPLYARHGIPEYWIVNIPAGHVEVYRAPTPDGYAATFQVGRDGTLTPEVLPNVSISAAALLG
jgi:Uma2 family endonuclease